MALAGRGAIAIWHDIVDEGREKFYAWHGNEHMRERIAIPGFLRGRRYVSVVGEPEYFNLYETLASATVTSAPYLERLNNPTPWTLATVPYFRAVSRSLCTVAATFGRGQGGLIGTFRYAIEHGQETSHQQRMATTVLPALAQREGVAGCHLLIADEAASRVTTTEKDARVDDNLIPPWIVLLECWGDHQGFEALCRSLTTDEAFEAAVAPPALAIYRLQNSVDSWGGHESI